PSQREMIIDEVFGMFKDIFGFFPSVAGSWLLDAHSMAYMSEKYNMKAFCICREQFGVDAYTLWGGYYSGAYYPSKKNMIIPAQTENMQIHTPVFRMLGIDPIYGYDEEKYSPALKRCFTMEPCWPCGQDKCVMDWYFKEYYENPVLNYSHATTGQENSFGLEKLYKSYPMQAELIAKWRDEGKLTVETLGESGSDFSSSFDITPPSALIALDDWSGHGHKSVWFSSRFYRANLFLDGNHLFFRDIRKYDENYTENYLTEPCEEIAAVYDAFPLVDGRLFSEKDSPCELAFDATVKSIYADADDNNLKIKVIFEDDNTAEIDLSEEKMVIKSRFPVIYRPGTNSSSISAFDNGFICRHNGYEYSILTSIAPEKSGDAYILSADNVIFTFNK
ncbi:MAG: hypothetical protein ACI4QR_04030, partial [Eubacteriales bacterium]